MSDLNPSNLRRMSRSLTAGEIAGRTSDPRFYAALNILPNPDVVLRATGKSEEVFDAIKADAHVIGELRSVRSGLNRFRPVVALPKAAEGDSRSARAKELCEKVLERAPAPEMTWPDVFWNMGEAVFRGYRVHEVVWERSGNEILPAALLDRPNRRFKFDVDNQLRILTKEQPLNGIEREAMRFLLTRHMPSSENPYGQALFSSCFWPYTFKHGGFRWFVKFCERMGIPMPLGKYPAGSTPEQIDKLEQGLEGLIEAGYIAMQDGGHVELIETKMSGTGRLPQHSLVIECNREMSKALTSQTLATEIDKAGARAASETHRDREEDVNESDREIIAYTMDELFRWITHLNVGVDVVPPKLEFQGNQKGSKERAETYEIVQRTTGNVSISGMHEELGVPMATDENDRIKPAPATPPQFSRSCPVHGTEFVQGNDAAEAGQFAEAADAAIESEFLQVVAEKLAEFADQGKSLKDFRQWLESSFSGMDASSLSVLTAQALELEYLRGLDTADEEG